MKLLQNVFFQKIQINFYYNKKFINLRAILYINTLLNNNQLATMNKTNNNSTNSQETITELLNKILNTNPEISFTSNKKRKYNDITEDVLPNNSPKTFTELLNNIQKSEKKNNDVNYNPNYFEKNRTWDFNCSQNNRNLVNHHYLQDNIIYNFKQKPLKLCSYCNKLNHLENECWNYDPYKRPIKVFLKNIRNENNKILYYVKDLIDAELASRKRLR